MKTTVKRAVNFAETSMGEAIGRDYVQLYFPPDAKAKMDALVANVKAARRVRLEGLDWMSPATRAEALKKLENLGLKIGYPDEWRDYSTLEVANGDLFGNALRAQQFEWDRVVRGVRGEGRRSPVDCAAGPHLVGDAQWRG